MNDRAIIPTRQPGSITTSSLQPCPHPLCKLLVQLPGDSFLLAWLESKTKKSGSSKTHIAYHETVVSFREELQDFGMTFESDPAQVSIVAEKWAWKRSARSNHEGQASSSTANQRLSIISSLYKWARKKQVYRGDNPIEFIERAKVQPYAAAQALEHDEVKAVLDSIDRSTLAGKRDLALLSIGFTTGARVSEIAGMQWGHLKVKGRRVRVHFPRIKGGDVDDRELEASTSKVLMEYLSELHGAELGTLANETPVWVSLSNNGSKGEQLSVRAMENVCKKYTGSSKFHLTRHSFGVNLMEAGADLSEVQEEMHHENAATTGIYLKRTRNRKSKFGAKLEAMYGLLDESEEDNETT